MTSPQKQYATCFTARALRLGFLWSYIKLQPETLFRSTQLAFRYRHGLVASGSNGMYLSITCAEDLPWFKQTEATKLAENTLLGDYRVRQQSEACELWPRAKVDPNYAARALAPVLILTGEWDPVTPPSNAEVAGSFLPNSLQVVVPQGGHGFGGLEGIQCVQNLMDGVYLAGNH